MTVWERIKYARSKILHMTQEDFSKNLNVTRSNIANIEVGRINPTDRIISDIARIYSISEEWLRTGEGPILMTQTPDEELSALFGEIMNKRTSDTERRLVASVCKLIKEVPDDVLPLVADFAKELLETLQERRDEKKQKKDGD